MGDHQYTWGERTGRGGWEEGETKENEGSDCCNRRYAFDSTLWEALEPTEETWFQRPMLDHWGYYFEKVETDEEILLEDSDDHMSIRVRWH